jgi:hypothetical protein
MNICQNLWPHLYRKLPKGFPQDFFFSFIYFSIVRILQSPVHYHLTRVYRGIKKKSVKK